MITGSSFILKAVAVGSTGAIFGGNDIINLDFPTQYMCSYNRLIQLTNIYLEFLQYMKRFNQM